MNDTNLVNALREHAEWARANEWETPITLGDDLAEAADRIEAQAKEIEKLREYLDTGRTPEEVTALGNLFDYALEESKTLTGQLALLNRIRDLAKADKDGRLVVLPCKTLQKELLEQYPTADVDESGVLEVCPALLFASHRGKKGGCSTPNRLCGDCRKEFWGLRAEAELEAMKDE